MMGLPGFFKKNFKAVLTVFLKVFKTNSLY
jgi:hypothetical protein